MRRLDPTPDRAGRHVAEAADRLAEGDGRRAAAHLRSALGLLEGTDCSPCALPSGKPYRPRNHLTPKTYLERYAPRALASRNLAEDAAAVRDLCDEKGLVVPLLAGTDGPPVYPQAVLAGFYLEQLSFDDWGSRGHV